ncbi:MAG: hypothetical protein B5M48_00120 [Candidatus Omnitrophica bacterium 4484_213]|nr:MAG: hypothetical protein B5M48_00120 [Candidatus Omnitrophica bacterium 4484_213]
MPSGLLSFNQSLEYLGITKQELKKLIRQKKIIPYRIGGTYLRFKKEDLDVLRSHLERKIRKTYWLDQPPEKSALSERLADFWYFNNLYIFSAVIILVLLVIIFR